MTRSTMCSGAEAPAVTPIVPASRSHVRVDAALVVDRDARGRPPTCATSTRRLEFEELAEPMTSTTSARAATAFTASWRFCVA